MATSSTNRPVPCEDFLMFQDVLKKMRVLDDGIVHALNTAIPSASFANKVDAAGQCKQLFEELQKSHKDREVAIKRCIGEASTIVGDLKKLTQNDNDNIKLYQKLRKEQTKLRLMQAELNVEEVVQDTANKVFYEKCRNYYLPPEMQS